MSERSAASPSAVPGADSADPSGTASDNSDDSSSAPADHEASSSPEGVPDGGAPVVESPDTCGNARDVGAAASVAGGETGSDAAAELLVADSGSTGVEPGAVPPADPEADSAVTRAAVAATVAAEAATFAASAAAAAADAAAEAAAASAEAAEAAALAADLAAAATRGSAAGTGAAGEPEAGDDVPEDDGSEAATHSDVPGDETVAEAEPRAGGIAAWGADRRRDLLAYIGVPLVTLFAAPALVLFWGIVILGSSSESPAICDGVRAVNGCEELTWRVIRVHVLGFLGLWALLWALPWWRGLRRPRVLLALAAGVVLFAGLLRLAA
ncbi:hypothetical protein QLQ12_34270 [Actinoplanes sp. NEAU-A12]|uniref:Uncharacterized protein n=1 Tax=Actinoplanes sandaracinus TaxID=3045177 RepID=A0ABT6WVC3_9ACTN|nr:hypothetical protein [Actinoplanes sandaracinus]MDI6103692.1 hypothetical protein [Actinoplanes sandaracinus]